MKTSSLTLVTGADSTHARTLLNFLASAKKYAPLARVVVYDLGMANFQLRRLKQKFDYEVRKFDYTTHPTYFNIKVNAGEYAWKPVIVAEVAREFGGIICWMDAGNLIVGPISEIVSEAKNVGFYRTSSGGKIGRWTHPATLAYFNLPYDWKSDEVMLASGLVAFDTQNKSAMKLLLEWAKYAQIKECIAPEGSNRKNHRQDQALLAVLAGIVGWPEPKASSSTNVVFQQDADFIGDPILYIRRKTSKFLRSIGNT